ncbi:MAG: hypothetical protein II007_11620 [Gammaproteobacteria bacterium]|nr:hypothetical protein [Gammaproteobacteria bacterium]
MLTARLSSRLLIATALLLMLIGTRGHHFASLHHLPSASWAVFFIGGLYLARRGWFALLMASAVTLDLLAVTIGGVDNFCVSPAYPALLAAYGSLWLAGRQAAQALSISGFSGRALLACGGWLLAGFASCELLSSGSFYLFSGHFSQPSLSEFGQRLLAYGPANLQSLALYSAGALALHGALHGLSVGRRLKA